MEFGDTVFFYVQGFGELEGTLVGWDHTTGTLLVQALVDGEVWEVDNGLVREE